MRQLLALICLALAAPAALAQDQIEIYSNQLVRIETSMGDVVVELDHTRAPLSVEAFVRHAVEGFYDGTIIHRVDPTFLIQGGGFLPDLTQKESDRTVPNESGNGLSNRRGTIGMARSGEAHSASSEFYFNVVDNTILDPRPSRWGYAVFGEVVEGMDVIDAISSVPTGAAGDFDRDVPVQTILIERVVLIDE